jgi:hypothetical protein
MTAAGAAIPRPVSSVLHELLDIAEGYLFKPSFPSPWTAPLDRLHPEVAAAVKRPCDGVRVIHAEALLLADVLIMLDHELRFGVDERAQKFAMLAGALLPMVKANLYAAVMAQRPAVGGEAGRGG